MHIEDFRNYCLHKKGVEESFPFNEVTLVFKVMGKMFALSGIETFDFINLKCDPDEAIDLRDDTHPDGTKSGTNAHISTPPGSMTD